MPDVLRIAFLDEFLTSFIWPKIDLSSFCTPLLSIYVFFLSLVDTMCGSWDKRRGGAVIPLECSVGPEPRQHAGEMNDSSEWKRYVDICI